MYEPLHHKYRPQTFAQLVGQGAIADTLTHALQQNRIAPAYLFCGPRGTGKTSSARILAKSLNCLSVEAPTAEPCGQCDVCQSVARGNALDIVEIDAASNTGVDNIRELIERAQFAPVQCRYKVYVIDECLTGDTQVLTDTGTLRIDDPNIVGRKVLSYNESLDAWELKPVIRRFEQGIRQTYTIATDRFKIKCTDNHLIRTEAGWVAAKNVKEGMKILSPVNVDAVPQSLSTEQTGAFVDLFAATSSKATNLGKSPTVSAPFLQPLSLTDRYVPADAVNGLKFPTVCEKKATAFREFSPDGKDIHLNRSMVFGSKEPRTLLLSVVTYLQRAWALSMGPCWETELLRSQTVTADFHGCPGLMENHSNPGWSTRPADYLNCVHQSESLLTKAMEISPCVVALSAILNWLKSLMLSSQRLSKNVSRRLGWTILRWKVLPGGTWMMDRSSLQSEVAHVSKFTPKVSAWSAINFWLAGYQKKDIPQKCALTNEQKQTRDTLTSASVQPRLANSCQTLETSAPHQWNTSLETVKSIEIADIEQVYDIEVADNHNFVANGLLVHNCHMLSTAAFNALLKTLEEPPNRVVFVLATTDPQRVLPTIISRCQRFDFRRIPLPSMVKHLGYISVQEQIKIAESAVQLVAQISQGGLRDAESLLDQLSLQADEITVETVWDLVGAVPERDLLNLVRAIAADDSTALLDRVRHLMDKGREPLIVLQSLVGFYRDLLIAKRAPARVDLVAITPPTWAEMTEFAQHLSAAQMLASQQKLQTSEVQVKNTTQPRLWLEITLTGLLPSALGAIADLNTPSATTARRQPPPSAPAPIPTPIPAPLTPSPIVPPVAAKPSAAAALPSTPTAQSAPAASPAVSPAETGLEESTTAANDADTADAGTAPVADATASGADIPPVKPPDAPAAEPAPEVAFGNMADLWNKALAVMEPRGTQILMSQQGVLLGFDGVGAKVGFRSASLQKLAQSRVPNLEAAFETVFKRKIKVLLEVVTAEEAPITDVEEPPPPPPAPPKPNSKPPNPSNNGGGKGARPSDGGSNPANRPSDGSTDNEKPSNGSGANGSSASYSAPNSSVNVPPPAASQPPIGHSQAGRLPSEGGGNSRLDAPTGPRAMDQDQEKIKRFANFFNGQIVNLDDETNGSSDDVSGGGVGESGGYTSSDPGPDVPF